MFGFNSLSTTPFSSLINVNIGWIQVTEEADTWDTITPSTDTWTTVTPSNDTWLQQG